MAAADLGALQPVEAGGVVVDGVGVVGDGREGVAHAAGARARAELEELRAGLALVGRGGGRARQQEGQQGAEVPHRPLPLMMAILMNLRLLPHVISPKYTPEDTVLPSSLEQFHGM